MVSRRRLSVVDYVVLPKKLILFLSQVTEQASEGEHVQIPSQLCSAWLNVMYY